MCYGSEAAIKRTKQTNKIIVLPTVAELKMKREQNKGTKKLSELPLALIITNRIGVIWLLLLWNCWEGCEEDGLHHHRQYASRMPFVEWNLWKKRPCSWPVFRCVQSNIK